MDIVLDTNIYRESFRFESHRHKVLLNKTSQMRASILMPQLVWEELQSIYKRELRTTEEKMLKARGDLNRLLGKEPGAEVRLDLDQEVARYMEYILGQIHSPEDAIVAYQSGYLPDIVSRAINRRRPCSDAGEEFRDAILWLTVLDVATQSKDKAVVFITNNKKQFSDSSDASKLHSDLIEDMEARKVAVFYFESIERFLDSPEFQKVPRQLPQITRERILELFEPQEAAIDFKVQLDVKLIEWANQRGMHPIKKPEVKSIDISVDGFFIEPYEHDPADDPRIRIQATYKAKMNVEFEIGVWDDPNQRLFSSWEIGWRTFQIEALSDVEIICDENVNFEDVHTYDVRLI